MLPRTGNRQALSRSRIVVGAVLLVTLLLACTDEEAAGEDFRAQADAICKEADDEISRLERPQNPARARPFLEKVNRITRDALDRLDRIQPPDPEDADAFQNMIDLLKVALFYQPQLREAVEQQNVAAAQEVRTKIANTVADAQEIARTLDLKVCAAGTPGSD